MDPLGGGIDESWQGIRIGGFQLGKLAPINDPAGQVVACGGKVFKRLRARGPLAGFGFLAARQFHLAKQDVAQLFGRAHIELATGKAVNLILKGRCFLSKISREA